LHSDELSLPKCWLGLAKRIAAVPSCPDDGQAEERLQSVRFGAHEYLARVLPELRQQAETLAADLSELMPPAQGDCREARNKLAALIFSVSAR